MKGVFLVTTVGAIGYQNNWMEAHISENRMPYIRVLRHIAVALDGLNPFSFLNDGLLDLQSSVRSVLFRKDDCLNA